MFNSDKQSILIISSGHKLVHVLSANEEWFLFLSGICQRRGGRRCGHPAFARAAPTQLAKHNRCLSDVGSPVGGALADH